MASSIKSIAYSFCEGFPQPYALDVVMVDDGKVTLDVHRKFETRDEFFEAMEGVIPMIPQEQV